MTTKQTRKAAGKGTKRFVAPARAARSGSCGVRPTRRGPPSTVDEWTLLCPSCVRWAVATFAIHGVDDKPWEPGDPLPSTEPELPEAS